MYACIFHILPPHLSRDSSDAWQSSMRNSQSFKIVNNSGRLLFGILSEVWICETFWKISSRYLCCLKRKITLIAGF